ncbi:50S ribosomal protein L14e, partial [Candidatus Woesearchaeota archaeon]|nr:50S ribosomal protein L14e [Candidatus Woesearchaeota archaeon]
MAELIGRICVKLLGREAGSTCAIIDELDGNFVLIDGNVRRRKCNLDHLEISEKTLKVKKNAST